MLQWKKPELRIKKVYIFYSRLAFNINITAKMTDPASDQVDQTASSNSSVSIVTRAKSPSGHGRSESDPEVDHENKDGDQAFLW